MNNENFSFKERKFWSEIVKFSVADNYSEAIDEWKYVPTVHPIWEDPDKQTRCICTTKIMYICPIHNIKNDNWLNIGSCCINNIINVYKKQKQKEKATEWENIQKSITTYKKSSNKKLQADKNRLEDEIVKLKKTIYQQNKIINEQKNINNISEEEHNRIVTNLMNKISEQKKELTNLQHKIYSLESELFEKTPELKEQWDALCNVGYVNPGNTKYLNNKYGKEI